MGSRSSDSMFEEAIKKVNAATFLIAVSSHEEPDVVKGACGTGFFIDKRGYFLTAWHGIRDILNNGYTPKYAGNTPEKVLTPIGIEEIYKDPDRDIFLGKISKRGSFSILNVCTDRPAVGECVCLCGYPLPIPPQAGSPNNEIILSVSLKKHWVRTRVCGYANVFNYDKSHWSDGILTEDSILTGMSGGPLFDSAGRVYGVIKGSFAFDATPTDKKGFIISFDMIRDIFEHIPS